MRTPRTLAAAAALLALAACDNPAQGGSDGNVRLRFGVAESQALASRASFQTGGADQLELQTRIRNGFRGRGSDDD